MDIDDLRNVLDVLDTSRKIEKYKIVLQDDPNNHREILTYEKEFGEDGP